MTARLPRPPGLDMAIMQVLQADARRTGLSATAIRNRMSQRHHTSAAHVAEVCRALLKDGLVDGYGTAKRFMWRIAGLPEFDRSAIARGISHKRCDYTAVEDDATAKALEESFSCCPHRYEDDPRSLRPAGVLRDRPVGYVASQAAGAW